MPVILWASLWAHPRRAAHAVTYLPLRRLYRAADAVVTYGPHVSAYVRARGARNVHVAPQSVDNAFWSAPAPAPAPRDAAGWPPRAVTRFLFVGRPDREKGLAVLLRAWAGAALAQRAALMLVGVGSELPLAVRARAGGLRRRAEGVVCLQRMGALELRSMYAACDVLVMNRGLPVIASDAVGAAAGGLVRDGVNGLVVPAGDHEALANALRRLAGDAALRTRLGRAGAEDVRAFSHETWAEGFSQAFLTVGIARERW